ncbi:hypothetical protein [Odoribacter lunatus]|nr:hypothetical protein [Odoribacter lunatus]
MKTREVITYKEYFDEFFKEQSPKAEIKKAEKLMDEYYKEKRTEKKDEN